jgi:hypothetical protein
VGEEFHPLTMSSDADNFIEASDTGGTVERPAGQRGSCRR